MNTRKIAVSGVLAALVFVATFFVRFPIPATEGYVNLGDAVILVCAFVLGPFAAIPAAIGSAMGDLIAGYAHYIIPTLVIKGTMGFTAGVILRNHKKAPFRVLAFVAAELIMVGGYFLFESLPFMYGVPVALTSVPFNAIQGLTAIVVAFPLSYVKFFNKNDNISA